MAQFHKDAKAKFGVERIMIARVTDLFVQGVGVPFEVRDVDGQEKVCDVSRRREIVLPLVDGGSIQESTGTGTERGMVRSATAAGPAPIPTTASREALAGMGAKTGTRVEGTGRVEALKRG